MDVQGTPTSPEQTEQRIDFAGPSVNLVKYGIEFAEQCGHARGFTFALPDICYS
jgi:hypothetical protein